MRPDTFTITTFWLDWLLMPIMLVGALYTARWALEDSKQALVQRNGWDYLPSWTFSIPLFIAAAAWVIAGFGALIKEDYWEMRVIFVAFLLWTLCCMVGATLLLSSVLRKGKGLGTAGNLNMIGLSLMSLLMILPGLIDHSSPSTVTMIGHLWFFLLAVSAVLLTSGMLMGFPFKFPRFSLGLGGFFLMGWGLSEIAFSQASFPWLVRIWKRHLGLDYLDNFPITSTWQIAGAVKAVLGIIAIVILIVASRRKSVEKSPLM